MISPIFFSFYIYNLFNLLKSKGSGFFIGNYYAGCFGYAVDLLFLCPSRRGLQEMLDIAQKYVENLKLHSALLQNLLRVKQRGLFSVRNL